MPETLSLARALAILRLRWKIIVFTLVLVGALTVGAASLRTPQYEAKTTVVVGQDRGLGEINSVLQLNQAAQTFSELITDRDLIERAARTTGYDGSLDALASGISSRVPANTQVVELTVRHDDAEFAAQMANAIVVEFSKQVEDKSAEDSAISATPWQDARVPKHPSGPSSIMLGLAGVMAGLVLGAGLAFMREHLDSRWKSINEIENFLEVEVLGVIPNATKKTAQKSAYR